MMKSKIRSFLILIAMSLLPVIIPVQTQAQGSYISYQVFYDQLSPYGQWVNYPDYGYVWLPDAGPDFFPYSSGGNWIMTEYGWTWLSDYDWGWAPFHYGRWDYDSFYGWFWVPDNIWGPAWVTWLRAPGYYGWAPMCPGMYYGSNYNDYNNHWIFARDRYFGRSNYSRYYARANDYDRLLANSTVINNIYVDNNRQTTYISGPGRADVQGATGRRVNSYTIQENNEPGQSVNERQLRIYRPQVAKSNENDQSVSPARITTLQDLKRPAERSSQPSGENIGTNSNTRQIQRPGGETRQNASNRPDAVTRQNTSNHPDAVNRQNSVDRQDAVNRQEAVDRQNALNRQTAVDRQNSLDKQNAVNRQNAIKQQDAVDQQNADNNRREQQQIEVNRQNTINRQNAVNQQNAVNRQNTVDQEDAVTRQNAVNRQNAADQQKAVSQQDAVNQQNNRNNERAAQQQNEKRINNERRQQQDNSARTSKNMRPK